MNEVGFLAHNWALNDVLGTKVLAEKETIDNLISKQLIGWKLKRLAVVDRNLLRISSKITCPPPIRSPY